MKIILLTFLFIILCSVIYVTQRDNFVDETKDIDLVIARYNEDLEWLKDQNNFKFRRVFIYNKGSNRDFKIYLPNMIVVDLPNVGRDAHTFLYHIINKFEDLAQVTIFLPGSADQPNKYDRTKLVINKSFESGDSVFPAIRGDLKKTEYNFQIDNYQSSNSLNKAANPESALLPSPERPFGKWFEKNFGNINVDGIVFNCIFSVSQELIRQNSIGFYKNLMKYFNTHSSPEAVHYIERSWLAVFHPVPPQNIMYYSI